MTYEEIASKYEELADLEEARAAESAEGRGYHMEKALLYRSEANRQRAIAEGKESAAAAAAMHLRDAESAIAWRLTTVALHERNVVAWESIAATLAKAGILTGAGPDGLTLFGPRGTEIVR